MTCLFKCKINAVLELKVDYKQDCKKSNEYEHHEDPAIFTM